MLYEEMLRVTGFVQRNKIRAGVHWVIVVSLILLIHSQIVSVENQFDIKLDFIYILKI